MTNAVWLGARGSLSGDADAVVMYLIKYFLLLLLLLFSNFVIVLYFHKLVLLEKHCFSTFLNLLVDKELL